MQGVRYCAARQNVPVVKLPQGGWFLTAFSALTVSLVFASFIYYFKLYAVAILLGVIFLMFWRNHRLHSQRKEEDMSLAAFSLKKVTTAQAWGRETAVYRVTGVLAVIGDLFKTEVYALARSLNRDKVVIPESVLTKAPSAELRPDQTDQDSLPPYELLDQILQLYLLDSYTLEQITTAGFEEQLVKQVLTMVGKAEFKRRQAPPVLKVSPRAFGTGRRIPIARHIHEA